MAQTFSVGRIFDIRVGIHISWLAVFAMLTYAIGPQFDEIALPAAYGIGALCALGVFGSLVVHEFAHALVARRFGVQTRAITLFLFGGVAALESEPPTPKAEVAIALAGPAASAALAGLIGLAGFGLLALAAPFVETPAGNTVFTMVVYLAFANAALAVFNLLPSFPMDGGRVLRAALWRSSGSQARATATAALVGIVFAAGVVAGGIVLLVLRPAWLVGWYLLIGGFLTVQSVGGYRIARRALAAEGPGADEARNGSVQCPTPAPPPRSATIAAH